MKNDLHIPVLLNEAIAGLNIKSDGIYVDMTLGRAGHSSEILKKLNNEGCLICFDQDLEAIAYSKQKLSSINSNYQIINDNFRNIEKDLDQINISKVDGVLFDLGVSSPQFDEDYRGFSYRYDAPLDMRMNQNSSLTAKYIVNEYSFEELLRVFKEYGEDKYSYNIAKNICKRRETKPIETTLELVEIVKASKPKKELDKVGHPAKQIFQALRIEVNDELNALEEALIGAIKRLKVNGRIVVITFQSLEDRIVKNIFRKYSVIEGNRLNDYINPKDIKTPDYQVINRKVITPSEEELKLNHRSKSAKLRILEKVKWQTYILSGVSIMKDKLVKYHHKAVYFYFKKVGICFSIFVGASVLVAVPVSIAASIRANEINKDVESKGEQPAEAKLYKSELLEF